MRASLEKKGHRFPVFLPKFGIFQCFLNFLKCFCDYYMPVSHFQNTRMFLSVLYSFLIAFCRKDFMIGSLDYSHYNLLPEIY